MSLDVYLKSQKPQHCYECGAETKFEELYSANITHNLTGMASAAGIYKHLWRPEEVEPPVTTAAQLIEPLKAGVAWLKANPEEAKKHDAQNGWGLYKHFVPFVENYLEACVANPEAQVKVSR